MDNESRGVEPDPLPEADRPYERWSKALRAVAHPLRLRVLDVLLEGPRCVRDVNELVDASQPRLSKHLGALRDAGLVASHTDGNRRCYYLLDPDFVRSLVALLRAPRVPRPRPRDEVVREVKSSGEGGTQP